MSKSTTTPHRAASRTRSRPPPPRPRRVSRVSQGPATWVRYRSRYVFRIPHISVLRNKGTNDETTTSVYQDHQQQVFLATPGGSNRSAQRPRFASPRGRPEVAIALPITPATVKARGNVLRARHNVRQFSPLVSAAQLSSYCPLPRHRSAAQIVEMSILDSYLVAGMAHTLTLLTPVRVRRISLDQGEMPSRDTPASSRTEASMAALVRSAARRRGRTRK